MSGFRWNVEAFAGPAHEGTVDGRARLLVRVRLFDEPEQTWPHTSPDAYTDLRTDAARDLAFELLAAAEHADMLSRRAAPEPGR